MAVIMRQGYTINFVIPTPLLLLLLSSSDDGLQSLSHSLSLFPLLSESFSTMVTSESAFAPAHKNILGIHYLTKKKHVVISYSSEIFSNACSPLQFQQMKCSALTAVSICQHKVICRLQHCCHNPTVFQELLMVTFTDNKSPHSVKL